MTRAGNLSEDSIFLLDSVIRGHNNTFKEIWIPHTFQPVVEVKVRVHRIPGYGIVFNALFINDCARTQFTYVLMWFCQKRERVSTISRSKQKSEFLRQFLKTRDLNKLTSLSFTLVHRSEQCQV